MATGKPEQIDEERRLLYVAMTRAREHLHLVQPRRFYRTQQHRHGRGHVLAPQSRFLPDEILGLFTRVVGPPLPPPSMGTPLPPLPGSTSPSGFARCGAEAFGSPLVGAQPANPVELATMRVPSDWPTTAPRAAISGRISGRTGRALSRARASSSRPITMPAPGLWHRECLPAARRWVLRAVRSRAHVRPTSQPAARHPVRRLPCRCAGRDVPHPLQCQTRHPAIRTTVAAFR